jgi:16S rRNA (guanine527-N7)-methyltransferase
MNNLDKKILIEGLEILGLAFLNDKQLDQFNLFHNLLLSWNKKINLISRKDVENIITKHFLDSLTVLKAVNLQKGFFCADAGAGAGFPSIPLLIYEPDISFVLIESIGKKVRFLKEAVKELKLPNVEIVEERAEALAHHKQFREKFDLVFARALAKLPKLLEFCLPLAKVGGKVVAQKGPDPQEEIDQSQKVLALLGGKLEKIESFFLPFTDVKRTIIVFEKLKNIPLNFPRSHKR